MEEKKDMNLFSGTEKDNFVNWERNSIETFYLTYEEAPFMFVEEMPSFQGGGISKFRNYIDSMIKYPVIAVENNIQGEVVISFIIDKNGQVINPSILNSFHPSIDYEVIQALLNSPKWTPGKQRGRNVLVQINISIFFRLDGNRPINENNRIATKEEFNPSLEKDPVLFKAINAMNVKNDFFLWTNKLKWINLDKFFKQKNTRNIGVKADFGTDKVYVIFNQNRSILRPSNFNTETQTMEFNNIPNNTELIFVGIRSVNNENYLTHFKPNPNISIYTPDFIKIDKNNLKNELDKIGL